MNGPGPWGGASTFAAACPSPGPTRERISRYSALLAPVFGLDAELVRGASWLHDIGMGGLRFVRRPGPLSRVERHALEQHPERGAVLLRASGSELLDTAAVIALTHHEHFDGDRLPQRLRGERIPLAGRILAVADAYDALTTDRPYRLAAALRRPRRRSSASAGSSSIPRCSTRSWSGSRRSRRSVPSTCPRRRT